MLASPLRRTVAGAVVAGLGVVLLLALFPYVGGLLGAPMLYVFWEPVQQRLVRRLPPPVAASLIIALTILLIVLPGIWLVTMLVNQAQSAAAALLASPILERLQGLVIGPIEVGPLVTSTGRSLVTWIGGNALSLIGTAARMILNLVFAFFGLYFLLNRPGRAWAAIEPYVPFSPSASAALRERFTAVTISTVIGTGFIALVQGALVGSAFWVVGIRNAVFWGAVTAIFSILPILGSGLVWLPGAIGLLVQGETGRALGLVLWGALVVGNVDNFIRPLIYNRFALIHPMITLVGAIIGVQQMGFIGLILGPLAISYFFELTRIYCEEYALVPSGATAGTGAAGTAPPPSSPPPVQPAEERVDAD